MGWSSGSELAETLWNEVREYVPKNKRKEVANAFVDAFESYDCDTIDECEVLMDDAQRPEHCWNCGDQYPWGSLGGGLCDDCQEEE